MLMKLTPNNLIREAGLSRLSRSRWAIEECEKSSNGFAPPIDSLYINVNFNAVELSNRNLSLLESFPGDYHSLLDTCSTGLLNLLEIQLLRCLLVGKAQREKCSRTIKEIQSRMNDAIRNAQE